MRILAFDWSTVFRSKWEANDGKLDRSSRTKEQSIQTVADLRGGFDRVAICCDESLNEHGWLFRGESFRRYFEPGYKRNRDPLPASYYESLRLTLERLDKEACSIFYAPKILAADPNVGDWYAEGDDLCGSLAEWCKTNGHSLLLFSSDKDALQIVDDAAGISVRRSWEDKEPWNEERVQTQLVKAKEGGETVTIGVPPRLIPDFLALAGDGVDNFDCFPGWADPAPADWPTDKVWNGTRHPGIGPVNAVRLLQQYGSATLVVEAALKDDAGIGRHVQEVIRRAQPNPHEALARGMLLASLHRNLPIDWSALEAQPQYKPLHQNEPPRFSSDDDEPIVFASDDEVAKLRAEAAAAAAATKKPKRQHLWHKCIESDCIICTSALPACDNCGQVGDEIEEVCSGPNVAFAVKRAITAGVAASKLPRDIAVERYRKVQADLRAWCQSAGLDRVAIEQVLADVKNGVSAAKPAQSSAATSAPSRVQGSEQTQTGSDAIVVAKPAAMSLSGPVRPRNLAEVQALAEQLIESRLFPHLPTWQSAMAVMLEAMERNMHPVTALRLAYIVNGRVGWPASVFAALVRTSGLVEYIELVECTHDRAMIEWKKPGRPVRNYLVTNEDAERAGYLSGSKYPVWKTHRKLMLAWMAWREACRLHFPEVCSNIWTPDELPGGENLNFNPAMAA